MKTKVVITVFVFITLALLWCYGNILILGDITRAHEYIGRGYGIAAMAAQEENKSRVTSYKDLELPECGKIDSPWCGYYVIIKVGIRIKDSGKDEVIAVMLPGKSLPFWYWGSKTPPAIVLMGSMGSYQVNLRDVPLKL